MAKPANHRKPWTEVEIIMLREHFPNCRTDDLAQAIGRNYSTVAQKAATLGLRKSAAYLASPDAHRLDGVKGMGSRFKPGAVPWNKGAPGSTGLHPRSRATQFKPGTLSGRAAQLVLPLGTLRVNDSGLLERKVSNEPGAPNKRWHSVHRLVWEAEHGKVPAGHVVVFKAGRRTIELAEITLDALELVTRAENMRRNSVHTKYPPAVARIAQLRGVLTRQINRKAKEGESA